MVLGSAIDLYNDIYWNGMSLATLITGRDEIGVVPNSPPNAASFGVTDVTTIEQGRPSMTVVYDDSTVMAFDLDSFYFGIDLAAENDLADPPQSGNVTVTGISVDGSTVVSAFYCFWLE